MCTIIILEMATNGKGVKRKLNVKTVEFKYQTLC